MKGALAARALGVVVVVLAVTAGCASPRASLGTDRSPCFQALPAAADAVGHQGHFAGVALTNAPARFGIPRLRRRTTPTTTAPVPSLPGQPASTSTSLPRRSVCLVAFKGTFDISKISLLGGPNRSGVYAIVVVGVQSHRALEVTLSDSLAKGFRHL